MKNFYWGIFILIFGNIFSGFGQIYSSKADYIEKTDYDILDRIDSIFVFNLSGNEDSTNIGLLEIYSPDSINNWDFSWYLFDEDSLQFNFLKLIKTENDTNYSSLSDIAEGGYSVIYTNGVETDTTYAWVFISDFITREFRITHKDAEGKLMPARYTCDYVELKAIVGLDTFVYYDETTKEQILLTNSYQYSWTSDPHDMKPNETRTGYRNPDIRSRTGDPPAEDTYYFLEVTDKYGITKYDTVFYETIHTKAKLDTIPQWPILDDSISYYDDDQTYSAPLTILFSPKESKNAHKFVYNFGDGEGDTTYYEPDSVYHTFYYIDPQNNLNPYKITLTTYSEEECSSKDSIEVELLNSELDTPPFFSPNDDGINDKWRVYDVSIREFEVTIFNRWGRVVHKFNGDDIRDWQGWDGNFKDSNRPAPEGVYYYVLRSRGWDKKENDPSKTVKHDQHGFFHLFRQTER